MSALAPLFLIEKSQFLQVTKTNIKSRKGSTFGYIRHLIAELAARERLKKSTYILIMGEML